MTDSNSRPVVSNAAHPNNQGSLIDLLVRICAGVVLATALIFLLNNYLTFWREWPGLTNFLAHQGWLAFAALDTQLTPDSLQLGWLQLASYLGAIAIVIGYVLTTPSRSLRIEADRLSAFSAYIVRVAFWGVLIIGLTDMIISMLRVEGVLATVVG